jgi:hypothetical protein
MAETTASRLRDFRDSYFHTQTHSELLTLAADEIEQLTAALKPFADVGKKIDKYLDDEHCYHYEHRARDYREAARVI